MMNPNKNNDSLLSRALEFLFIRAGLATAVGFGLEFLAVIVLGNIEFVRTLLDSDSMVEFIMISILFHIAGWIIVQKDWKNTSEHSEDSDPGPYHFRVEQGNYTYVGDIYRRK